MTPTIRRLARQYARLRNLHLEALRNERCTHSEAMIRVQDIAFLAVKLADAVAGRVGVEESRKRK